LIWSRTEEERQDHFHFVKIF